MTLQEEIRQLQQERTQALRATQFQFARTRRDIREVLSPRRFIRRHKLWVTTSALVAGLVLAPQIGGHGKAASRGEQPKPPGPHRLKHRLWGLLTRLIPPLRSVAPVVEENVPPAPAEPRRRHLVVGLLAKLLPTLIVELERHGILQRALDYIAGKHRHNGRSSPPETPYTPVTGSETAPANTPTDPPAPE